MTCGSTLSAPPPGATVAAAAVPAAVEADGDRTAATGGFTLELPLPPSVNRSMANLGNQSPGIRKWRKLCDGYLFAEWPSLKRKMVQGWFTADITWTVAERGNWDADNRVKPLLDYLQDRCLIENDKFSDDIHVHWGQTSFGCRVTVRPCP